VAESLTFIDVVRRAQDDCLSAYAHQHLPFGQIQALSPWAAGGNLTRPRIAFAFQGAPFRVPRVSGAVLSAFDTVARATPTWDQWWQLMRRGTQVDVAVVYNAGLFTRESIRQLRSRYAAIVTAAGQRPEQRIGDLLATL
jgi:hypothetical protein